MRDKVRSLPAFRKSDVIPNPRQPNTIWCRRDLAQSKVPRAGSSVLRGASRFLYQGYQSIDFGSVE
jgi:hypothetical protein